MRLRLRLFQAATVLLYMGPLLAGLAGFGWGLLPPFALIFTLALVLSRPHQWPQTLHHWRDPGVIAAVVLQILSQVLLVVLCLGIGRGIGGVLGYLPLVHAIVPLGLCCLGAMGLGLCWDRARALRDGLTVDNLLYPVGTAVDDALTDRPKG